MKRPGTIHGIVAALVLALGASMIHTALGLVLAPSTVLPLLITALAGAYVVYLLGRSGERSGRLAVFVLWVGSAAAGLAFGASVTTLLLAHVVGIWVIRALYFHGSVLTALVDLALSALGLSAALWAAAHSASVFLTVWCFFLVQALFVVIPESFGPSTGASPDDGGDRFQRAYAAAERAVHRIAAR